MDWGLYETEAPRISRQLTHEGNKVISRTHRPLYASPPGDITGTLSVTGWDDPRAIVWPEWSSQWKTLITPHWEMNPQPSASVPQPIAPPNTAVWTEKLLISAYCKLILA